MKYSCFLLLMFYFFQVTVTAQPRLEVVGGTDLRMGRMYTGQVSVKRITLKNRGNDTLLIGKIETSCGCTVPHILAHRIAPNDSTTMTVQFNSQFYEGPVKKELYISSNAQPTSRLELDVRADVSELINVSSQLLKFGRVKLGSVVAETVVVANMISDTVRLLPVKSSDPQITVKLLNRTLVPDAATRLVATLRPKQEGHFFVELELKTEAKWQVTYKMGCYAHVIK
ncbi:MAG: DUF1573 domain-containing protein [Ignavibacteria bacterium]|nr:DUF1573 domain-containing protein [Ignavibacteria bacterium]